MFAFGRGHTDYVCVAGAGCVLAKRVSAVIGLWHGAVGGGAEIAWPGRYKNDLGVNGGVELVSSTAILQSKTEHFL